MTEFLEGEMAFGTDCVFGTEDGVEGLEFVVKVCYTGSFTVHFAGEGGVEVLLVRCSLKGRGDFLFSVVLFEGCDFFDDGVHCGRGFVGLFLCGGHVAGQLLCY